MLAGAANSRHEARERALQILYAVEIGDHEPRAACDELLNGGDEKYVQFVHNLVQLAASHREELDEIIRGKAQKWDLERIALLDRLILRLALCELFYLSDIPPKVTINEAIEVAKEYSTDQSGRFINGILDAVYTDHEAEILRAKKEEKKQEKTAGRKKTDPSLRGSKQS